MFYGYRIPARVKVDMCGLDVRRDIPISLPVSSCFRDYLGVEGCSVNDETRAFIHRQNAASEMEVCASRLRQSITPQQEGDRR